MNKSFHEYAGLFLMGGIVGGCAEPLKEAQQIQDPRVLGVRVDVAGSSEIEPAESMTVDLLLADEGGPLHAQVALRLCEGISSDRGVPTCSTAPFHEVSAPSDEFPLTMEVPEKLPRGKRILLIGAACIDANPRLTDDPLGWSCADGSKPLRFSFETTTASEQGEPNQNPNLTALTIEYDGVALVPDGPGVPPACGANVVALALEEKHELTLTWEETTLESGEELQLSHFTTRGQFERAFSFPAEGQSAASLEFETGSSEGPIKQYVVVRDGRGGVSWASWTVCQR